MKNTDNYYRTTRCPHCNQQIRTYKRVCFKCDVSIKTHHKYITIRREDNSFHYEHRNCHKPDSYA